MAFSMDHIGGYRQHRNKIGPISLNLDVNLTL